MGDVSATVQSLSSAVVDLSDDVSVMAEDVSTVQSSVGDVSATVQSLSSTVVDLSDDVSDLSNNTSAMWGVKLQLRSNEQLEVAGVGLGISNEEGVTQSEFVVRADRFVVLNSEGGQDTTPFTVDNNGTVIIRTALIGDATITMAKIGGDLYSTNYVASTDDEAGSGWILRRDGTFEINSPVPGQGRTQINNQGVRVYDASNQIRVKLGDLS